MSDTKEETRDLIDKNESDEDIIKLARQRFNLAAEHESENRAEELDDLKFMVGDQWPQQIRAKRETDKRPCLTINRLPQFVRQVTNDQRQNRPSIKINPVDDKADVETAKLYDGMIRHIEYSSHADVAYDTAFEGAATTGLGYFRIVTEYADSMSFQQEIKIKRIKDRFSVYVDPFYQEPDGSDMNWAFIVEDMSKEEFKTNWPDAQLSSMGDWDGLAALTDQWVTKDSVRVAEYFTKTYEKTKICLLTDGTVILKDHLEKIDMPQGVSVKDERETLVPKIRWYKINGLDILDRTEIPGEWIPVIPVIGEEHIVNGKRIFSGIIRQAKDSQRMLNYWKSAETETIALAPRAPFIVAEGQIEDYEAIWDQANTTNLSYLPYKPTTVAGVAVPPPQRNVVEPPVQAITQASMQSSEDLKATTGIYDATLGNRSNEQSGVAIQRRNLQAQTSNFHFIDNLARSIRHAGRIVVNWIPKIYDTATAIRIIQPDGQVEMVAINNAFDQSTDKKVIRLDSGKYDVTVDTGPSFQTKRQEAVDAMLDLTRTAPQLMQVAGDLLVGNMDWPGAREISERIKKTLPPQIVQDDKDGPPQIPPQVQQQLQQQGMLIQKLSQELNENTRIMEAKAMELQSRERIEAFKAQNDLVLELLKHNAKDGQMAFQEEMKILHRRLDMIGANQSIDPNQMTNDGSGGDPAAANPMMNQTQQPTGGFSPGQPMGANP